MKETEREFETPNGDFSENDTSLELGKKLKAAREAAGLDYRDLTEITRLRPQYLEAIEQGRWDELPSSALARGFVNTYARALGLDAVRLMARYGGALPARESPLSGIVPSRRRKRIRPSAVVACLLVIALGAAGFMMWQSRESPLLFQKSGPHEASLGRPEPPQAMPAREKMPEKTDHTKMAADTGGAVDPPPENSLPVPEAHPEPVDASPESVPVPPELPPAEAVAEPETHPAERAGPDPAETAGAVTAPAPFTLKAEVTERTWMRISVDGGAPREYIFPPGREPEWQAREGFDLLIGNAGGLELELNGKRIGPFGASGQVVRLKLPEAVE